MTQPAETQVVALMGGLGTRLGAVGKGVPKPIVSLGGSPFFEHTLRLLRWHGFREFLFLVGHFGEAIEEYFGNGDDFGVNIDYSYDGERLLGTGGALRKALPLLSEDVIVIYGDSYMDVDFGELLCHYQHQTRDLGKLGLMAVYKNRNRFDKSNVLFREGELLEYNKSAPTAEMEHIDYGISLLRRSFVEIIPPNLPIDLAALYQEAVKDRRLGGVEVRRRFYEIGSPSSLREFADLMEERQSQQRPAIFLDRDGTLNEIVYNDDTERLDSPLSVDQFRLVPGVIEGLRKLQSLAYNLIVITNQPAAAKGKVSLLELYRINAAMEETLFDEGIHLADILMCPHHPQGNPERCSEEGLITACECRKPGSLLIRRAIEKLNVDVERSYFVGDSFVDVLAARQEAVRSVLLGRFKCDLCERLGGKPPDMVFPSLVDFADYLEGATQ